ncbi:MAG: hypothetical protein VKK42_20070 [Lyngbya sp.]|nr:hypothetical protein [Lyngbya sp.]
MIKQQVGYVALFLSTFLGLFNYQLFSSGRMESTQALAQSNSSSEVITVEGKAYVLPSSNRTKKEILEVGTKLSLTDVILKPEDSELTILCGNGILWYVETGEHSVKEKCSAVDSKSTESDPSSTGSLTDLLQRRPIDGVPR